MNSSTTQDEILRTLKSITQSAANTDEISTATAGLIANQGEQIRSISHNANTIETNLDTSERLIRGIKSWGGRLANMFGSQENKSDKPSTYPSYMPSVAVQRAEEVSQSGERYPVHARPTAPSTSTGFQGEVDAQLDSIAGMVSSIKEKSLAISANLSEQVVAVESADKSVARSTDRINKQHNTIKQFR